MGTLRDLEARNIAADQACKLRFLGNVLIKAVEQLRQLRLNDFPNSRSNSPVLASIRMNRILVSRS